MKRPVTLTTIQDHAREIEITGRTSFESPGIEISVTFTPDAEFAARALVEFDAKVADIRRGIAAYTEAGQ